jgi:predicted DsbA family dithiol-disulfide isomerase
MRVDIWSDLVCPWCYVGKRRFERALADFAGRDDVDVVHRSFQLNPAAPRDHQTNRREMLMRKYRLTPQQVDEMDARMVRIAAADGLEYHLDGTVSGNTGDAHQLVHFARDHGAQDAMIERLYRAYFVDRHSIFDRDSLVTLAGQAGLDQTEAGAALREDRYAAAVERDMEAARRLGITGVPFFLIDERVGVSGAQSSDVFLEALRGHHSVGL